MKSTKFIGFIFLLSFISFSAVAQSVNEKCVIRGWVQDKEPRKDISIYKVPSWKIAGTTNDPFNGYLDNSTEPGEEKSVEIIGFKAVPGEWQWIKIRQATDLDGKILFQGDGWIPFERVTAKVQSPNGKAVPFYSQPRNSGKKVGTIPDKTLLTIIGFDCFGLKIKYRKKTGWLSAKNICGNPVTTCV